MPQVAIPHILGTVMLIGLLGVVILYAQNIEINDRLRTASLQLKDISEYVASEVVSLVNLAGLRHNSRYLCKALDIPKDVNGMGYTIELRNISGRYMILVYLDQFPTVNSTSYLYFSEGISIYNGTQIRVDLGNNVTLVSLDKLYSGLSEAYKVTSNNVRIYYKPAVWCEIRNNHITIGLGRLEVSGYAS